MGQRQAVGRTAASKHLEVLAGGCLPWSPAVLLLLSATPPSHAPTRGTQFFSVPLPLPAYLSPLHTLSNLRFCMLDPVPQQNCQPKWGRRALTMGQELTPGLYPRKALFCTCLEGRGQENHLRPP